MAIFTLDNNDSSHSSNAMSHEGDNKSAYDSEHSEEESDGGWSDDDGDSDSDEEDCFVPGEEIVAYNHIHSNNSSNKEQPQQAINPHHASAPVPPLDPSAPMDGKQLKLAMQKKRMESMQQHQQAMEEALTKSPPGKKKMTGLGALASEGSPKSKRKMGSKPPPPEEEEDDYSSSEESESESESEESTSSEEESSAEDCSSSSEYSEDENGGEDDIARQEQNVKTVQQVLNVDNAAHDRFLAFMKNKKKGVGMSNSSNNHHPEPVPQPPPRRKSKTKYSNLGDNVGQMNNSSNGDEINHDEVRRAKKKEKKRKEERKRIQEKQKERQEKEGQEIILQKQNQWRV